MSLKTYVKKRDFKNTPEPEGKVKKSGKQLSFVIQRHDASHLHYDFRLELDGVLKSWAVPKGPSLDPGDKRLAVMVEDHPIKYGGFSGKIPEGNYGAGTVEIWDRGTYEPEAGAENPEKEIRKGLAAGSLKFVLHGEQLNGSFALVALKNSEKNWLLIKHKDSFAEKGYAIEDHPSIIGAESKKDVKAHAAKAKSPAPKSVRAGNDKLTDFIHPMLASLGDKPFDNEDWIFEIKWDGYRAIAEIDKKEIKLYSRNGLSFAALYPSIAEGLKAIKKKAVVDGEIVALDKSGKPDFQALQNQGQSATVLVYYLFDCLSIDGKDLTGLTLLERKKILKGLIPKGQDILLYSDHVADKGEEFFTKVVERGLEGMIAKTASGQYLPGKRTHDWLKIKNQNTQEAIIAGYTAPRNSRQHFGSLVLGMFEKKKLKYIGHTGTGFSDKLLKSVFTELKPLIRKDSPFEEKIPMREKVTWVDPEKVCNVKFSEITRDGILRHPVFMGMRIDKAAEEVDHLDTPIRKSEKSMKKSEKSDKKARTSSAKHPSPAAETKSSSGDTIVERVGGHDVTISHASKIYWPEEKITKGDVVSYYHSMAKYILPYLHDRPQSLKRNPGGIADKGFFHKDAAGTAPDWVEHVALFSEAANKKVDYILCNNEATLTYLNNLGCIEINPWNSRVDSLDNPDYLIIDIDPSDKNNFDEVIDVALAVRDILDKAGIKGYPKTSGATGMHVYLPLHAQYTYDQIRIFAEGVALMVVEKLPKISTTERSLANRKNRIYVDYLQNKRGQTLSSVYSLRPVPGATVSTPLDWKEIKHGLLPANFDIHNTLDRVKRKGDLFAPVLKEKIDLIKSIGKLGF